MRKTYDLTVGGQVFCLRLTLSGQKALKEQSGMDAMQFIFDCIDSPASFAQLLQAALRWGGENPNPKDITGEDLYNLLVDDGYAGQLDFARVAFSIAQVSGLITIDQKQKILKRAEDAVNGIFEAAADTTANPPKAPEASD